MSNSNPYISCFPQNSHIEFPAPLANLPRPSLMGDHIASIVPKPRTTPDPWTVHAWTKYSQ